VKDDRLYLLHINECIARIESYSAGGKDEFMASTLIQDAVIRNLQTLSESAQRLSDSFKTSHPEADWRGISGFRNVLVHDYIDLDLEIVWQVIERDLPVLRRTVQSTLDNST
jgi:uncharacterized protein with HEPN domain